jgi:hypothetical protein
MKSTDMDLKSIKNGEVCALCGVGDSHCNPLSSLLLLPFRGVLFHPTLRGKKEGLISFYLRKLCDQDKRQKYVQAHLLQNMMQK